MGETQLREQRRALGDLLAHVDGGMIAVDPEGFVAYMNSAAASLIDCHAATAVGRPLDELFKLVDRQSRTIPCIQPGELTALPDDAVLLSQEGREIPIGGSLAPSLGPDGQSLGVTIVFRDLGERGRIEQQLAAATEAADNANRTKREFLANISHELRTPMNAIIGMTELALDEPLPPTVRDHLTTVKESADSLLGLLNEILDFSRLESGKFVLQSTPFHLRSTLDVSIKALAAQAHEKGLELACHVGQGTPDALLGDPLRLRQVLMNLVGNAIKFTDRGEVVVRVEPVAVTETDAVLAISVIDTGIGISPHDQRRIFSPFTQADASTTRHYGGAGIGLAISSELVRLMGGSLQVTSEPGRGSTFRFTARYVRRTETLPANVEAPRTRLRGMSVLVVDNNPTNEQIVDEALRSWEMQPELVHDAPAALAKIHERAAAGRQFPLVILDAVLPGMDGFTLAAWIKGDSQLTGATIMMLTAADHRASGPRLQELDLGAVLIKPFSQAELLAAVQKALGPAVAGDVSNSTTTRIDPPAAQPSPQRILVAEDTPANQRLIVNMLHKQGHQVAVANNGREAVELVERSPFDLVLMDVQMPVMDGLQATSAIRKSQQTGQRRLPIVAMTAHVMNGDRERCLAAGMDEYLPKPIDSRRLTQLIYDLSQENIVQRETPEPAASKAAAAESCPAAARDGQAGDDPVCDIQAALGRMAGDRGLLAAVVQFFLEDAPDLFGRIEQAVRDSNSKELESASHALKGLAANFGAKRVIDLTFQLETAGRSGQLVEVANLTARLQPELARLEAELRRHRAPAD